MSAAICSTVARSKIYIPHKQWRKQDFYDETRNQKMRQNYFLEAEDEAYLKANVHS